MSMTENEAKFYLNDMLVALYAKSERSKAINMAIQALEEIQQYRAIGTVEELKSLKENNLTALGMVNLWYALEDLKRYSAIGTIDEFKALKDKATPKKDNNDGGRCKYCGTYNNFIINKLANPKGHPVIHCWNCGQALDWQ